jgi:hypothetical protein
MRLVADALCGRLHTPVLLQLLVHLQQLGADLKLWLWLLRRQRGSHCLVCAGCGRACIRQVQHHLRSCRCGDALGHVHWRWCKVRDGLWVLLVLLVGCCSSESNGHSCSPLRLCLLAFWSRSRSCCCSNIRSR